MLARNTWGSQDGRRGIRRRQWACCCVDCRDAGTVHDARRKGKVYLAELATQQQATADCSRSGGGDGAARWTCLRLGAVWKRRNMQSGMQRASMACSEMAPV